MPIHELNTSAPQSPCVHPTHWGGLALPAVMRTGFGLGGMVWEDELHTSQQNRDRQTQWRSRGGLDARSHRGPL